MFASECLPFSKIISSYPKYLQANCAKLTLIFKSDCQLTTIHISPVAFINSSEGIYCIEKLLLLMKIAFKLPTLKGFILTLSSQYFAVVSCIFIPH